MEREKPGSRGETRRLTEFGKFLVRHRKAAGYRTQADAAAQTPELSQSVIAQLELGKVDHPSERTLRRLCDLYRIKYDVLLWEYLADRYCIPAIKKELLASEIVDLDEMLKWQGDLKPVRHLWIIAPRLSDLDMPKILQTMIRLLEENKDCEVTYFVGESNLTPDGIFQTLIRNYETHGIDVRRIIAVALTPAHIAALGASFVIANPQNVNELGEDNPRISGRKIVLRDGNPWFAIPLSPSELLERASKFKDFLQEQKEEGRVLVGRQIDWAA